MIEKLKVYKDAYLLVNKIYDMLPKMERLHRYTIGTKLIDAALSQFRWISLANQSRSKEERIKYIDKFLTDFEIVKIYLRICADRKFTTLSTLASMFQLADSITGQMTGWRNATCQNYPAKAG